MIWVMMLIAPLLLLSPEVCELKDGRQRREGVAHACPQVDPILAPVLRSQQHPSHMVASPPVSPKDVPFSMRGGEGQRTKSVVEKRRGGKR